MPKKKLKGKVVGDKNDKTVVVIVERKYQHPFLKKVIKTKKKYQVHDENNKCKVGDVVQIEESKPWSKYKRFKILEGSR